MKTNLLPKSVIVLPICLLLNGSVANAQPNLTEKHQAAIAAIKQVGGKVDFRRSGIAGTVNFDQTAITDADLVHLIELTTLDTISLRFVTNVTGTGFAHFKGLTNLANLYLPASGVTDAGLAHLKHVPSLVNLYLRDVNITDAGLAHLSGLVNLRILYMDKTRISDAGLAHLKTLRLGGLYVQQTAITDAGLEHLAGMANLKALDLSNTKVTSEGVKRLQARLPDCKITF